MSMSKANLIRTVVAVGMVCTGVSVFANPPNVSNVTLIQPQGTQRAVVSYETDGTGISTFQFMTNGVDIVHSEVVRTVTGDINQLLPAGTYSFTWDAKRDFPEQLLSNLTVKVTLWATNNPPQYCAVNLVEQNGQYPVRWYGKETEVPFGVNHSWWKRDWLLLRQIPSTEGEFVTLGSPVGEPGRNDRETLRSIRITKPFYMGVFSVTQRQWQIIYGDRPSYFNNSDVYEERPVEQVSYNDVRGTVAQGCNWPINGHAVFSTSFMGRLRAKTGGILEFDLPTEAQWEYACRAGTSGAWNNGTTCTNATADANLDLLGRYRSNGGYIRNGSTLTAPPQNCTDEFGTAKVGLYPPNAWGLYDMHGNVWNITLDWLETNGAAPSLAGDDPAGPALTSGSRTCRGGSWDATANDSRSARRGSITVTARNTNLGIRVAARAEIFITQ